MKHLKDLGNLTKFCNFFLFMDILCSPFKYFKTPRNLSKSFKITADLLKSLEILLNLVHKKNNLYTVDLLSKRSHILRKKGGCLEFKK